MYSVQQARKKVIRSIAAFAIIVVAGLLVAVQDDWESTAAVSDPVYQGPVGQEQVAFAVNIDWGEEYLPAMLEIFTDENVTATFFLTGRWCEQCPQDAKMIVDAGMEIGNHGYKHKSPNGMTYAENVADIDYAEKILVEVTGQTPTLFAPASGEVGEQVVRAAADSGYKLILWTVDTIDWQRPSPELICQRVDQKLTDGAIILMHPTENTVAALPTIIGAIRDKGYNMVTISELLETE